MTAAVTGSPVSSYLTFSPLPSRLATGLGRCVFCGTFPGIASAGRYPAPCSAELGLSSNGQEPPAIISPTRTVCIIGRAGRRGNQGVLTVTWLVTCVRDPSSGHRNLRISSTVVSGCRPAGMRTAPGASAASTAARIAANPRVHIDPFSHHETRQCLSSISCSSSRARVLALESSHSTSSRPIHSSSSARAPR